MKNSYTDRISNAHKSGHLFVHMLEFPIETDGTKFPALKNLLDVMAKVPNSRHALANEDKLGNWKHDFSVTEHGIMGLATTALHAKYPVKLWTEMSNVGLLMEGAKPVLVSSGDNYTEVHGNQITFLGDDRFSELQKMQGITKCGGIDLANNTPNRFEIAASALKYMWECIKQVGWSEYLAVRKDYKGVNEVNVAAELKNICGLVVSEAPSSSPTHSYAKSIKTAAELKSFLIHHYPEHFDASLPIYSYAITHGMAHGEGKPKLETISPEVLAAAEEGRPFPAKGMQSFP